MGKKRNGTSQKHIVKRSTSKVYVKGDEKVERIEKMADFGAKAIALSLYPLFLATSGVSKLTKKITSTKNHNIKYSNGDNFIQTIADQAKSKLDTAKPFVIKHKWVLGGVGAVVMVSALGFVTFNAMTPSDLIGADTSNAHVVSVPTKALETEVVEDSVNEVVVETAGTVDIPEIKVMSMASVKVHQVLVNNKPVASFKTENEANRMLEALKAQFTLKDDAEILDVYFKEEVKVSPGYIDIMDFEEYDTVETALEYIRKGTREVKIHKVQKGENYWVIADYYGVNPYDLEAANPDIKAETLQIGMEISLVTPRPLINVVTVEKATYSDKIAFEVEYEPTNSLYKGETKTKVGGAYGERVVEAELIRHNGREIGRSVISENITAEPQTKVVYQGTKDPPPRIGTGTLAHPTSRGIVTSEFGWRWGRQHTGIDIGLNIGTSVKAADGGVVTFAGYSSSYGRYIIIDHGGNLSTLYAHNSVLNVKKGDKVFQGQVIAASGNTGYSTGPHLHFEVRKNGVPQNPRNYVKF